MPNVLNFFIMRPHLLPFTFYLVSVSCKPIAGEGFPSPAPAKNHLGLLQESSASMPSGTQVQITFS